MCGVITRRVASGSLVLLAGLVVSACSTEPESPGATDTQDPTELSHTLAPNNTYDYVALGDSYAALGSTSAATTGPEFCLRSTDNYPAGVLASELVTGSDATCQGAVTQDLIRPRVTGQDEIPAQVDSLTPSTGLVTLSIGGNDIGFGDIAGCFLQAMNAGQPSHCAGTWEETITTRLRELPSQLDEVYHAIADRSDGARIITTGYLPLIAPGDDCAEIALLGEADRAWVSTLTDDLNGVVADAARRHGATLVLPTETAEHTGCAATDQRWVDFHGDKTGAYAMHPTPAGQVAMAEAILSEL